MNAQRDERNICITLLVGYFLLFAFGVISRLLFLALSILWSIATGRFQSSPLTRIVGISGLLLSLCIIPLCLFYWRRFHSRSLASEPRYLWLATALHSVLVMCWLGIAAWEEKLYLEPGLLAWFVILPGIFPLIVLTISLYPLFIAANEA